MEARTNIEGQRRDVGIVHSCLLEKQEVQSDEMHETYVVHWLLVRLSLVRAFRLRWQAQQVLGQVKVDSTKDREMWETRARIKKTKSHSDEK